MLFELIAVIVAGFAGAGLALLLGRILRGRLPKWVMPVAAGAAMLAVTISNEYGWYPRTAQGLPEGLEVAMTVEDTAPYRPWTYAKPFVSRFLAVDRNSARTNDAQPGVVLADVYAFARWTPPSRVTVAVDCAAGRRAEITGGASFGADGTLLDIPWRDVGAEDEILAAFCDAG
jgi:hypothetical protein